MQQYQSKVAFIPLAVLFSSMLLWSSSFSATKIALMSMHPTTVMAARMLVAVLAILPFAANLLRMAKAYRPGDWKLLGLMVLFEPCLLFLIESYALTYTTGSQASMIVSLLPVMVLIAAHFTLKEPISGRTALGAGLAVAGAVWLSIAGRGPQEHAPNPLLGNFLEFLAMVATMLSTLLIKKLTMRYSPHFLTACQAVGGLVFALPISLVVAGPPDIANMEPKALWAVVYLGVAITIGAYGLWNVAISMFPAGKASVASNLIPVFSVLFCFLVLGERFNAQQFIASGAVLFGVVLTTSRSDGNAPIKKVCPECPDRL